MVELFAYRLGVLRGANAVRLLAPGAAVLAMALLTAGLILSFHPYRLPLDDAYITLHNAEALWAGGDRNYGGSGLAGATSLIHLALVALLVPLLGQSAAVMVSFLAAAAYLLGIAAMAERQRLSELGVALVLLVAVGTGSVLFQLFNGMETALAMALVTWAIVLASAQPSRTLAALCGALPFVRPELGALSLVLLARQAVRRRRVSAVAADMALAAAAAAPWLLLSFWGTGHVIPVTAGAKAAFFAQGVMPLPDKMKQAAQGLFGGLGPALLGLLLMRRSSLALALVGFVALFMVAFIDTFPIGLSHNWFRYTYALLPVCLWALCDGWSARRGAFWALGLVLGVIAPLMIWTGALKIIGAQGTVADSFEAARWAASHLPADEPILVHDAGIIAYATPLRLVDVVGLKTPAAVIEHQRLTAPSGGRARGNAITEIARRSGARYAMIMDDGGNWSTVATGLGAAGWRLTPLHRSQVQNGYVIYKLSPPS